MNRNKTKISEISKISISEPESDIKAEEMCMSPLRAIASPQVMVNWQPKRHNSTFKPKSFNQEPASPKSVAVQPDFKIKKAVGDVR